MLLASLIAASIVVLLAAVQLCAALYFNFRFGKIDRDAGSSLWQPPASVVLSIRGNDPSLRATIMGLLDQQYAVYELILVVDHHTDEAWDVVTEIKRRHDRDGRIKILELDQPQSNCGLKCSALVQAFENIAVDSQVLVLIDADIIPHTRWLSTVVEPLQDESVGIVTGNHWFEPTKRNLASMIRSTWNAGAIVPTAVFANPWAGTCAMRVDDIHDAGMIDIWKRSIVDDGPLRSAFKPLKKSIRFVPGLIMLNQENCTSRYVIRYITRMLTWSRIYEPTFASTAIHMFATVGSLVGLAVLATIQLFMMAWIPFLVAATGITLNSLLLATGYLLTRNTVAIQAASREQCMQPLSVGGFLTVAAVIPFTQLVYAIGTIGAITKRSIKWRKITYALSRTGEIHMVEYRPLGADSPNAQEVSI